MPWKEETAMSIKEKFITAVYESELNFSDLCKLYQISRDCGYKWLKRYKNEGRDGLIEKSRRPHSSPQKTSAPIERKILKIRDLHPKWGGRKIHAYLINLGQKNIPTPSTITRILHRHQKINKEDSLKAKAFKRFEYKKPNQMWQMDFKGFFYMQLGRCNPLTVLDDCSRYSMILRACKNQKKASVQEGLIDTFREYGLPERMTMDNGAPWGCRYGSSGFTELEVWLILLGINPTHSRPWHPQTQGKDERFHRTLKEELLEGRVFTNMEEAQKNFDSWREYYNNERPHEAIGLKPPASRYEPSQRKYPEEMPEIEYEEGAKVRQVKNSGDIHFKREILHKPKYERAAGKNRGDRKRRNIKSISESKEGKRNRLEK